MAAANLTTALRTRLLEDATLRDLVGDGVYPDLVPQGATLPAVRYEVLSDRRLPTLEGQSTLRQARVQMDAVATSRAVADRIGQAVERILGGLSGAIPETRDGQSPRVDVDDSVQETSYSRVDPPREGASDPTYRRTIDLAISYQHDALPPAEQ